MSAVVPTLTAIPQADAIRICNSIWPVELRHWWNPGALQCRGCIRFSKDVEHRCFAARADNRGCRLVSAAWDRERRALDAGRCQV